MSDLVGNPEKRFSHNEALISLPYANSKVADQPAHLYSLNRSLCVCYLQDRMIFSIGSFGQLVSYLVRNLGDKFSCDDKERK